MPPIHEIIGETAKGLDDVEDAVGLFEPLVLALVSGCSKSVEALQTVMRCHFGRAGHAHFQDLCGLQPVCSLHAHILSTN